MSVAAVSVARTPRLGVPGRRLGAAAAALAFLLALGAGWAAWGGQRPVRVAPAAGVPARTAVPVAAAMLASAAAGRHDRAYRVSGAAARLHAANPAQGLRTSFTADGLRLRGGGMQLAARLRRVTIGGRARAVGAATPRRAAANRIEYDHGALTEWYINGPAGLEHGFTVNLPRSTAPRGSVVLELAVSGARRIRVAPGARTATFAGARGERMAYKNLWAADARGRRLPVRMRAAHGALTLSVDATGARSPITIDPIYQAAMLRASDGADGDRLGQSVAISGDTLVAGAPGDDNNRGAAYVFVRPAGRDWADATQVAKLTVPGAGSGTFGDAVGSAVAIDGATIVVSAPEATVGANVRQGALYVYDKPAGGWRDAAPTARLTVSGGQPYQALGAPAIEGPTIVGVSGNYYHDGSNLPLVPGHAYVFTRPAGGWTSTTQTATLSDASSTDGLVSVAISGDTIAAGSEIADVYQPRPGAIDIFVRPPGGWANAMPSAKLTAAHPTNFETIGREIAIDGDTIVSGVPDSGSSASYAYVFVRPPSGWANGHEIAKLTATDATANLEVGSSVAVSGGRIALGAVGWNTYAGAIYVYDRPAGGWHDATQTTKLTVPDANHLDDMGLVALDGDTIVGGAPGRQGLSYTDQNQGAVYTWVDDGAAPAAPQLAGTLPASPGNTTTPSVRGTTEPDATVRVYRGPSCTGTPAAVGSAATFATGGIPVAVAANAPTVVRTTATDRAGNTSACSTPMTYVEDSTAPDTSLLSGPDGPTDDASPSFGFSSDEAAATFECRVDGGAYAPCTSPFTAASLGEGGHTFDVRARDAAGNADASPAARAFTVDTSAPVAALTATAVTPLIAESVRLDASGSSDPPAGTITRYEWDLDGDGSFDTSTGATPWVDHIYAAVADPRVGVLVTDAFGRSGVATLDLSVRVPPPPGPTGVSINHTALYTNNPTVQLDVIWPARAKTMTISNDGGFRSPTVLTVRAAVPWRLASSGPERLPKTVYVRFDDNPRTTYTDDIILDQTPPRVRSARIAHTAKGAQLQLDATDNLSGIQTAQIRYGRDRRTRTVRYRGRIPITGTPATVSVRVTDGAGNTSRWKTASAQARLNRAKHKGGAA